ncbi:phenylalanine--tRNA ligase subunit beta [Acaricomes phytoseiuli]|uniref:phenylalanine--tRNA ligase subunit beta n=1 Tax=Acaricomes phytoseiuli TaxID=291968 RepID=UPI000372A793|nr:phenylalanine--tRNA ligase subunit beta [Acaricomes phytoseiuli]
MRIPLSWLRDYTALPAEASAEDLMADLVRVGIEEEAAHRSEVSGPVVVGQVLSKVEEPQKNGKTINWCQVRVAPEGQGPQWGGEVLAGEGISPDGVQGIVCGAHNLQEGDKVIVTLPGAVLPGEFRITPRKTYGHVSAGMIASARELGIGQEHDGILVLADLGLDAEPGTSAYELLGLDEEAAEVSPTPDRGYQFSMRGIAREYAHATGTLDQFTDPATLPQPAPSTGEGHPVSIDDDAPIHGRAGADRFVARIVRGIDPQRPTPDWLARRLRLAGIRPISLAVDISNYVMLELGQPMHFYDLGTLSGPIVVRRARSGERLTTLDGKDRALDSEDLLIADDSGPIGLAGVMGGASTEISEQSKDVLIEAAHFEEVSVARTRRRHKLSSEAAKRFERGVDWRIADIAAQRAADLLVELAGGEAEQRVTDIGQEPETQRIVLPMDYPAQRIGVDFTAEQIETSLRDLGAEVTGPDGQGDYLVNVPSWRQDLATKDDLAEEIIRLIGYDKIPATLPVAPPGRGLSRPQQLRRRLYQGLADAGLTEVIAYPFVSRAANQRFGTAGSADSAAPDAPMVKLANPISEEFSFLRISMLPGLLETAKRNVSRGLKDLAIFEIGSVFLPGQAVGSSSIPPLGERPADDVLNGLDAGIPDQPLRLGAVLAGQESRPAPGHAPRAWDYADALDVARLAAALLGVELVVNQAQHHAFHPGRAAQLSLRSGAPVGYAGELHPKLLAESDLPARTAALELDVSALIEAAPEVIVAKPLSTYPAATQDVALLVPQELPAVQVLETLRGGAGELLEHIELFDDYRGQGVPEGRKSLAFGLRFRAPDRTLTADEASAARQAAVAAAAEAFGAELR